MAHSEMASMSKQFLLISTTDLSSDGAFFRDHSFLSLTEDRKNVKHVRGILFWSQATPQSKAMDPDPHESAFIFLPGSGSRRGKFEGKKLKKCKENGGKL